jgi:(1->4)-alpha-D-glucan 1-alpha-D-glucosylmutase
MSHLRIPIATYRLQLNGRFHFQDAQTLVPYLNRLGISDLYNSPILKARLGSSHGYDMTDPTCLNSELGTEAEFKTLVQKLKRHGMGLLLDIVPNHMAASSENPWWMDFLENGLYSPYATFFDINWSHLGNAVENKVLLPILTRPYDQALKNRELALTLEDTGLFVCYHDYRLPLDVKSYQLVLSHRLNILEATVGTSHSDFQQVSQLIDTLERLPPNTRITSPNQSKIGEHYRERQATKERLWNIVNTSSNIKGFLVENIALFNGKKGDLGSFDLLDRLLEQQVYRLAFWETAREHINYRRFFDISDLIGVRVEEPKVFEATHGLIFQLIREGKVTGLRIDHIDGLYEPLQYLSRLHHRIASEAKEGGRLPAFYIIVEKILATDEALSQEWPVFGNTGYDFLNMVNALFVDSQGVETIGKAYSHLTGSSISFNDVVYEKKRQVIKELFPSEIKALGSYLAHLAEQDWHCFNLSSKELTRALIEVTACLPVYRTYIRTLEVSSRDRFYLEHAIGEARWRNPTMETTTLDLLKRILCLDFPAYLTSERKEVWLRCVSRWQQLTGAIMAKGFEDTALYTYNRLISLNEVGGDPSSSGIPTDEFHRRNLTRAARWPHTLNATSTHDTKRSEDVRARIDVLSEIPEEWERHLTQWNLWNRPKKQRVKGLLVPEPNMEILLYQTLIGAWPFSEKEVPDFKERLKAYIVKAAREAKAFTSWLPPNQKYESALIKFLEAILERSGKNEFLGDFLEFQRQIAYYGAFNSLAQLLLKITSPGVPDFYQGTELWDFSLVDPDNRRPVDFKQRIKLLNGLIHKEVEKQQSLAKQVLESWQDGRVKLYVTYKALNFRRGQTDLFLYGDYIPLQPLGRRQEHVCAFARRQGETWAIIAVPRLLTKLINVRTPPLGRRVWGDDILFLPEDAPERWLHIFTGETVEVSSVTKGISLSRVFSIFPVALLVPVC